jgi:hypothetical protein
MTEEKKEKELEEMPKWLQNAVKAVYLTGFSVILSLVFTFLEFILAGSNNPDRMFGYYIIAQMIVSFAFINGNVRIDKVKW